MNKKTKDDVKIRELQVQWAFVLFGTLVAFLGGLTVNALYDLIKNAGHSSPLFLVFFFGTLFFFFLDLLTFTFENFKEFREYPDGDENKIIRKYLSFRISVIVKWLKKIIFRR